MQAGRSLAEALAKAGRALVAATVFLLAVFAAIIAYTTPAHGLESEDVEIRAILARSQGGVSLMAMDGLRVLSADSAAPLNTGEVNEIEVTPHPSGLRINKLLFPVDSIRVDSEGSLISLAGKVYRGYFVVRKNEAGRLDIINHVYLEDYLKGVVGAEMPPDWPIEALKAQAVAARTYALFKRSESFDNPFDLESDINDQVYRGVEAEQDNTMSAVNQTRGLILVYKNRIARTYYHSTSGPRTENAAEVFGGINEPYLKSVKCGFDRKSPYYNWQYITTLPKIHAALSRGGFRTGPLRGMKISLRTSTGRVAKLTLLTRKSRGAKGPKAKGERNIDATLLRKLVGSKLIKSTNFKLSKRGSKYIFKGVGYGHGVGLCQWGAKGIAEKNFSFRKILSHYYPGTKLADWNTFGIE